MVGTEKDNTFYVMGEKKKRRNSSDASAPRALCAPEQFLAYLFISFMFVTGILCTQLSVVTIGTC